MRNVVSGIMAIGLSIAAAASSFAQPAYRLRAGDRLSYRFDYRNESSSDMMALFEGQAEGDGARGLAKTYRTRVRGVLEITVVRRDRDGIRVAYRIRRLEAELEIDGQRRETEEETLREGLERDMFGDLTHTGRLRHLRFEAETDALARSYARALFALSQFVLPTRPAGRVWETEEDDLNGRYLASYAVRSATRAVLRIEKRKSGYRPPDTAREEQAFQLPMSIRPDGAWNATFAAARGHVLSLAGTETQVISLAEKRVGESRTQLRLELLRRQRLGDTACAALREKEARRRAATPEAPLWLGQAGEEDERALQRNELGDDTLESLLLALDRRETAAAPAADTPLYLKLKALIYVSPASCEALGKRLRETSPGSPVLSLLIGALGAVGHEDAQTALLTGLRPHADHPEIFSQLLYALGDAPAPILPAENALRQIAADESAQDLAGMARLALCSMARKLAASDPERVDGLLSWTVETLATPTVSSARRDWLRLLGAILRTDPGASQGSRLARAMKNAPRPSAEACAEYRALSTTDRSEEIRQAAAALLAACPPR